MKRRKDHVVLIITWIWVLIGCLVKEVGQLLNSFLNNIVDVISR